MKVLKRLFRIEIIVVVVLMIKLLLSTFNIYAQKKDLSSPSGEERKNIHTESELLEILKKKQIELDKKEVELNSLKKEIEENILKLTNLQKSIESLITSQEKLRNKKIRHLAVIYSNMPAEKAAKLMEELESKVVISILRMMDGKTAGRILSYITPKKAAKISEGLTR